VAVKKEVILERGLELECLFGLEILACIVKKEVILERGLKPIIAECHSPYFVPGCEIR